MQTPQPPPRFDHIDMLRGLAALLVCVGHIRGMLWVDYGALASPDVVTKGLYFLTGLGHQAVVLFFALSGFLVGGSAFQRIRSGQFRAGDYLLRRLTRLWTVLLPALVLGALWDWLGRDILHGPGYDGSLWAILSSGPDAAHGIDLSFVTLAGIYCFCKQYLFRHLAAMARYGALRTNFSIISSFPQWRSPPLAGRAGTRLLGSWAGGWRRGLRPSSSHYSCRATCCCSALSGWLAPWSGPCVILLAQASAAPRYGARLALPPCWRGWHGRAATLG